MAGKLLTLAAFSAISQIVFAEPVAQPNPQITDAPLEKRQTSNPSFIGFIPQNVISGTTSCKCFPIQPI